MENQNLNKKVVIKKFRKRSLFSFLKKRKQVKNDSNPKLEYTHVSIGHPKGCYLIEDKDLTEFYNLYHKAIFDRNKDVYLVERHSDTSPLLIDIDFRFDENVKERTYTMDNFVIPLIYKYKEVICRYINITDSKQLFAYVFEKLLPQGYTLNMKTKTYKDGIHIMFPNFIIDYNLQFLIRKEVLKISDEIFAAIPVKNSKEDIIDEAVIKKNGWQPYGSKKIGSVSYELTHIYDINSDGVIEIENTLSTRELIEFLSIRGKKNNSEIKEGIQKLLEVNKKKKKYKKSNIRKVSDEVLEECRKLVKILSIKRADDHIAWWNVGQCLFNTDDRLLEDWIEFSSKSEKANILSSEHGRSEEHCRARWEIYRERDNGPDVVDKITIGSLHHWAREDNKEEYMKIRAENYYKILFKSLYFGKKFTTSDIAEVVHFKYKHMFVCANNKDKLFFEYKNHRWHKVDNVVSLRMRIKTEIVEDYSNQAKYLIDKSMMDKEKEEFYQGKVSACMEVIKKLKDIAYRDKLVRECADLFYNGDFLDKLDTHKHLIGFENGVYDLKIMQFREGFPDDYISFSTNIDYIDEIEDHNKYDNMIDCISKILPIEGVRRYVLGRFAQCLNGEIGDEKFHIWTGTGGNGKSKIIELFENTMGDYCCHLPTSILTQKRSSSNGCSPELVRTKGKRFVVLQEPDAGNEFNVGVMKELTGGDKIMGRGLYQDFIEFHPQFKATLTCNTMPTINKMDGGVKRRIRVVEFASRFVDNPDPCNPNEFKIDYNLDKKLKRWPQYFMIYLLNIYKDYTNGLILEPPEVMRVTKEYEEECDVLKMFMDDMIIVDSEAPGLRIMQVNREFNDWYKKTSDGSSKKKPKRADIKRAMNERYGKISTHGVWKCRWNRGYDNIDGNDSDYD